jgi:type II secretory pathway pseudopilin PulG
MKRRGLTLLELLVVLLILIALATIVVPTIGTFGRKSQQVATRENLLRLQELLNDRYWADMDELPRPDLAVSPTRLNHPQMRYLFVNPDTEDSGPTPGATLLSERRWNGPYVKHSGARYQLDAAKGFVAAYGVGDTAGPPVVPGDPAILDAWGRPIVLQEPDVDGGIELTDEERRHTRLVSAGPNGVIDTPLTVLMPTSVERGDDILIFLFRHDEFGEDFLSLEQ